MMVLPIIPKNIIRSLDNLVRDFLWNGSKSKIAYNILQNPKKQGGLNLVNIKHRDIALKATWPEILHQEEDYSKLVYGLMRCSALEEVIWKCNLDRNDVRSLNIKNQFWEDVLYSWCSYNKYQDFRIENQIIWRNSAIKIGGKTVFWKDTFDKGLVYVYQLFNNMNLKTNKRNPR